VTPDEPVNAAPADPTVRSFESTVRSVDGREVTLDRTYFYAEGGGQPPDRGSLAGVEVVDVQKRGGVRAWWYTHTIGRQIFQPENYYEKHPEYAALVNGKRRNRGRNTHLCTTYSEVVSRTQRMYDRLFNQHSDVPHLPLTPADGLGFCQCEQCKALDTGDIWPDDEKRPVITERWLTYINEVAARLQHTHLGKKIYTLAYHQTFRPPTEQTVTPADNVMIQVVNSRPNYLCTVHRLTNDNCPANSRFREGLKQWVEVTPGGVTVYQYIIHSHYSNMPFPAVHKFVDDIDWLAEQGVIGWEGQTHDSVWGVYSILQYAASKATWNPDMDPDKLIRD